MENIELEESFVNDVLEHVSDCTCLNPDCNGKIYSVIGKTSELEFIVDYNPDTDGEYPNICIHTTDPEDGATAVVFNGICSSNHDLAQVLRMVVI